MAVSSTRLRMGLYRLSLFVSLALAGCPGDGSVDAAGVDAGEEQDVGDDAQADVDAQTDARPIEDVPDAADPDVRADGGSLDPEWVLMPDLPEFCTFERALHPERLGHPMWESCGPGCEWLVPHPTHVRTAQRASGHHDGETGYAWVYAYPIADEVADRRYSSWIVDSSGNVLAAWRMPSINERDGKGCLAAAGVDRGRAVLYLKASDSERFIFDHYFYVAPVNEISEQTSPFAVFGEDTIPRTTTLDSFSLSDELIVGTTAIGRLLIIDEEGEGEVQPFTGVVRNPTAVGTEVIYEHFGDVGTLRRTAFGEASTVLLEADDADFGALHMDLVTNTMTWVRTEAMDVPGRGRVATRSDVYTSPLSTTREGIEPRYVANVFPEVSSQPVNPSLTNAGNGYFVNRMTTVFVRLSDGERLMMPRESGADVGLFTGTLWLADGWRYSSVINGRTPDARGGTLMRQRLDSLVPFTP